MAIVRALWQQLPAARVADPGAAAALRRRRDDRAGRIEALEGELDRLHVALHAPSEGEGPSYRTVMGELIGVEEAGSAIDAPRLRPLLGGLDMGALSALEETCGPLAATWLASCFEGSPLAALLSFAVDQGVEATLAEDVSAFVAAEAARMADRAGLVDRLVDQRRTGGRTAASRAVGHAGQNSGGTRGRGLHRRGRAGTGRESCRPARPWPASPARSVACRTTKGHGSQPTRKHRPPSRPPAWRRRGRSAMVSFTFPR